MKWLFLFVMVVAATYSVADYLLENWQPYASAQQIDWQEIREPTPVLCVSSTGDASTYLVMVPEYVGFSASDKEALEDNYKQGYCDHIRSL